jgi:hypothetical protein
MKIPRFPSACNGKKFFTEEKDERNIPLALFLPYQILIRFSDTGKFKSHNIKSARFEAKPDLVFTGR